MGCIIKRGTKDRPRFYLKYRDVDGVERMRAAKGAYTKAQARVLLAEIERRIMAGKVGIIEPTQEERAKRSLTVSELGAHFLGDVEGDRGYTSPDIKDLEQYRAEARSKLDVRIVPRLGDRAAQSLRVVDVEAFRDELLAKEDDGGAELSPASVKLTLAVLSKMYAWGRKVGLVDCDNPAKGCKRPRTDSSLDYLSRDEVCALLAHLEGSTLHPLVAACVYLGLRKGEAFGLRWIDVHLDGKAPRVDVLKSYNALPKSGKARHIPMNGELVQILRRWRDLCPPTKQGLVFPVVDGDEVRMGNEYDTLGLPEAMKAAKCHLPAKPFHCLRHSFASHFMMSGGNILTLQKLLGHADLKTTMIYAHLSPDHLAAEVQRMSFAPPTPADVVDLAEVRRHKLRELLESDPGLWQALEELRAGHAGSAPG